MLFPQHLYSMFRFSVLQKVHLLQSQITDACFHGLKPVLAMLILNLDICVIAWFLMITSQSSTVKVLYNKKKFWGEGVKFLISVT